MRQLIEQIVNTTVKHSAGGIIKRKGDGDVDEILMIQRAKKDRYPNQWEFPRGGCETGKDKRISDCMIREVKEETGLDVKPLKLVDKVRYIRHEGTNSKIVTICYNYVCKLLDPNQEVRLSKEHQSYKWISEVGEVELMASPEQKKTIQKVLNTERSIVSYPKHQKTEENINFYLESLDADPVDEQVGMSLPVYFSALLLKMAVDVYKSSFTRAARECKGYAAGEKQICMLRAQITAKKASLTKLQTNVDKCNKDKNPETCRAKVGQKIQTMQQEIGYLMQRQKELRGKAPVH